VLLTLSDARPEDTTLLIISGAEWRPVLYRIFFNAAALHLYSDCQPDHCQPRTRSILTLTNTLNYNLRNAMAGIIGVAVGMGVISIIAASSVGVMITTSQLTLLIVKGLGRPI
jgi:hypothetical protein